MKVDKEKTWDAIHSRNEHFWLTGHTGENTFNKLMLSPPRSSDVLEIGIGYGKCVKYLHRRNNRVTAVDISNIALSRVSDIASTHHVRDFGKINERSIDTAICLLVFQHCCIDQIRHLLTNSFRVLKKTGLLAFQCAFLEEGSRCPGSYELHHEKEMLYFHDSQVIEKCVQECGGKVVRQMIEGIYDVDGSKISWQIFHCRSSQAA